MYKVREDSANEVSLISENLSSKLKSEILAADQMKNKREVCVQKDYGLD